MGGSNAGIGFLGLQRIAIAIGPHGVDDLFGEPADFFAFIVNFVLQPLTHVLFAVVAGFNRQVMLAQGLVTDRFKLRKVLRPGFITGGRQQGFALAELLAGVLLFVFV